MNSLPLRVLYVDDEEILLDICKLFLERTKEFVVDISSSGTDALEILQNSHYDAIVSDYQMPVMDGIKFLIEVRRTFGDIPFILFTGKGREEVVIKAIDNGVDFYLQKGGDPKSQFTELAHKIKRSVERFRAVRTLTENEERMRLALDGANEGLWEINIRTGTTYLSPRGYQMLGYAPDEMNEYAGLQWRNLVHPDDVKRTEHVLLEYYQGRSEFFQVEQRLRMKNGDWKWMLSRGKVTEFDENNQPIRFIGTHTDITEQKKIESELFISKKEWETIFRAIGNPTLILDADHTIIEANEAALTLSGKKIDEIIGLKCWNLFHGPDKNTHSIGCPLEAMRRSGKMETVVTEIETLNRAFITSCTPILDENGTLTKVIHIATDITENKHLEENLRENRDYLDQIFSSVREGIVIIDADTHEILDINPAAIEMIGVKKEDILHHTCHKYICPAEQGRCPITDLNQMVDNSERILLTGEGKTVPIIKYVVPFIFKGRNCLLETFIDNSERKRTHDELLAAYKQISESEEELMAQFEELTNLKNNLQASETKFRTLIETTPDMIFDLTTEGIITYISPRSYDILGYSSDDLTGSSIIDLISPDRRDEAINILKLGKTRTFGIISLDFPFIHKEGREIIINIRSSPFTGDNGEKIGFRCVGRDVTEQIRSIQALNERTREVERLSAQKDLFLSQLAHDLRTPLTPIIGMGPLLLEGISDPDARELIALFLKNIEYLHKMAENILINARLNQTLNLDSFVTYDLTRLISEAIETNQYLADLKDIKLINNIQPGISVSITNPYAHQVFHNLINNAIKYNYSGGFVNISADVKENDVDIIIQDSGIGIPSEIQNNIWDELYIGDTARSDPLSKGLGLSIVRKIIELHKGTIEVFSNGPSKGTTFTIHLPKISESLSENLL